MARVLAWIPDLLFGSNVVGALSASGHEVTLVNGLEDGRALAGADVLIVDLTADATARIAAICPRSGRRRSPSTRTSSRTSASSPNAPASSSSFPGPGWRVRAGRWSMPRAR